MWTTKRIALTALALLATVPAWADDLMPGLSAQWIARDMELNGVPASMRSVSGSLPLVEVLRHYRRQWDGALLERRQGEWHVLATRRHGRFLSLRVRGTDTGVDGVLTDSLDPGSASPSLESTLPVPPGLERLAHQTFRDHGSRGENLTLMSRRSVAFERQAFLSLYENDGWVRAADRATLAVPDGHVLELLRGKEQLRIVLYRDPGLAQGRTLILVTAHRD